MGTNLDTTDDSNVVDLPVIDRYKIIRATDIADLTIACNKAMREGWVPLGGPVHCPPGPADLAQYGGVVVPHPYWQAFTRPARKPSTPARRKPKPGGKST